MKQDLAGLTKAKRTAWTSFRVLLFTVAISVVVLFLLVELWHLAPERIPLSIADSIDNVLIIAYWVMILFIAVITLVDISYARSLGRIRSRPSSPSEVRWLNDKLHSLRTHLRFDFFLCGLFCCLLIVSVFDKMDWNDPVGEAYLSIPILGVMVCIGLLAFRFYLIST
jgi:hypothetical protein